jgi:monoamine oxidase
MVLSSAFVHAEMKSNTKSIIVIGAGLSGLSVAKYLRLKGYNVTILEARSRIGGRIWTSDFWDDLSVDLGATWIHGSYDNPLSTIANEINAHRLSTSYDDSRIYDTSGEELSQEDRNILSRLEVEIKELLNKANIDTKDNSINKTLFDLKRRYHPSSNEYKFINFLISSRFEQEYAGSADKLSSYYYNEIKEFSGNDKLFVSGFQVITDYLALDTNIKLFQVVSKVDYSDDIIKVYTQDTTYEVDYVICTLPLGVLQSNDVDFIPALSLQKQQAIARLGMGTLNKCYLRFDNIFWEEDIDWLEYIPDKNHFGHWTQWVSLYKSTKKPVLLGFNAANRGEEIEYLSDDEIVENAMKTLKKIYGKNIPTPTSYQITRWKSDKYSKGSYSFNKLGSTPSMRRDLTMHENKKLFFAGEATHKDYFGTAHGAYLSGINVVNELIKNT